MTWGRGLRKLATTAGLIAALMGTTNDAQAQQGDAYTRVEQAEGITGARYTSVFNTGSIQLGLDMRTQDLNALDKGTTTIGIQAPITDNITGFGWASMNEKGTTAETKIQARFGKLVATAGAVSDGAYHAGIQHGFIGDDRGASIGYIGNGEDSGIQASAWTRIPFTPVMAGSRVAPGADKILTVVSLPSDEGFAARYARSDDLKNDVVWQQAALGTSRPGYYGLNRGDWFFFQNNNLVSGTDALRNNGNPLAYIPPPNAWLISDVGLVAEHVKGQGFESASAEAIKYVSPNAYITIGAGADGIRTPTRFSLSVGLTEQAFELGSGQLSAQAKISHDSQSSQTTGELAARVYLGVQR